MVELGYGFVAVRRKLSSSMASLQIQINIKKMSSPQGNFV
jgi:hypothetical protein